MGRRPFSLRTERLTIGALERRHVPAFTAYRNDPEVARYQEWELPYTRDLALTLIDEVGPDARPRPGEWVQLGLIDGDGTLVGDLAVWLDDTAQLAMIGYTLARPHQGKGYATEAVAAIVQWLFATKRVHRIAATIDPANLASARVLERTGFRYIGTARSAALVRGEWLDDARFELLADDWRLWRRLRKPAKRVTLIEVTDANVRALGEIDRAFSQRQFVSSVYQSYGDALLAPHGDDRVTPWMRAIAADGELAGFVMVAEPAGDREHPYLWRFLVDWRHQGRGVGRSALIEVGRQRAAAGASHLLLSCVADVPGSPEPFYRRLGFQRTGHVNPWGEHEMIVELARLLG